MSPATTPPDPDPTGLSAWQRWRRGLGALWRVRTNPEDTEAVLRFGVMVNAGVVRGLLQRLRATDEGRALLRDRPAIDSSAVDYAALSALPAGTLGHEYARFIRERNLDPDVFRMPPNVPHPGAAYLAQRMRQTHDLWHVLTGFDTDEAGEVALQAFTYAQLGVPSSFVLATLGSLRLLRHRDATAPARAARAYLLGRGTRPLLAFRWEDHWQTPVVELRRALLPARD